VASMEMFDCQNLNTVQDPKYFLYSDSEIECWTSTHTGIALGLALPMLLIFCIGVPIKFYLILKDYHHPYNFIKITNQRLAYAIYQVLVKGGVK